MSEYLRVWDGEKEKELKTSLLGIVGKYKRLNKYFRGVERLQPLKFVEGREKMMRAV